MFRLPSFSSPLLPFTLYDLFSFSSSLFLSLLCLRSGVKGFGFAFITLVPFLFISFLPPPMPTQAEQNSVLLQHLSHAKKEKFYSHHLCSSSLPSSPAAPSAAATGWVV
jgi:hypothetical protein